MLARLSAETVAELDESLPPAGRTAIPVDVLGDARSKRVAKAVEIVLQDPGVDAVLVIVTPQAMTNPTAMAQAIGLARGPSAKKPDPGRLAGRQQHARGRSSPRRSRDRHLPTPEQAVRAFMTLVAYARNLDSLYETPRDIPARVLPGPERSCAPIRRAVLGRGPGCSPEAIPRRCWRPTAFRPPGRDRPRPPKRPPRWPTRSAIPVVLKILSPDITHKTDVGGVALDLEDAGMVRAAFAGS